MTTRSASDAEIPYSFGTEHEPLRPTRNQKLGLPKDANLAERYSHALGYIPLIFQQHPSPPNSAPSVLSQLPYHNPTLTPVRRRSLGREQAWEGFGKEKSTYGALPTTDVTTIPVSTEFLTPGSIRASIFNLCSATLGAGALALPYAFQRSGLIMGIVLLAMAAVLSVYSIQLLLACRDATCLSSYEDLSVHCFGKKVALLVELTIEIFCIGTCVAYIVAVGDILQPVALHLFPSTSLWADKTFIQTMMVVLVMLPLSLVEKINQLRFASFFGVLSIIFLVLAITFRSTQHIIREGVDTYNLKYTDRGRGVFMAIPIIMFAFTCQVNVFSVYTELQRPSIRRMSKVVNRSFIIDFLIYFLMGVCGYLFFGESTQPDILNNLNLHDPIIIIAQICVGLTVLLAFPLNIFPARFTLEMMFWSQSPPSTCRFFTMTTIMVLSCLIVAAFTPGLDTVFSILGSTCCSIVCFILPAAFYLKCFDGPLLSRDKLPAIILMILGIFLGIVSTYLSIRALYVCGSGACNADD